MDADIEIREHKGIVVLLDALGYRNWSLNESVTNIKKLLPLVNAIRGSKEQQEEFTRQGMSSEDFVPNVMNFGDTILLYFKTTTEQPWVSLSFATDFIAYFLYSAFKNGVLLRGAITYGDYCCSERDNVMLGPAISDVASWYEQAQFIGVIGTPTFGIYSHEYYAHLGEGTRKGMLFEYDVLLKGERRKRLDTLGWPALMYSMESKYIEDLNRFEMLKDYRDLFAKYYFPYGTEIKLQETINFIDYCMGNIFDIVPRKIRSAK